MKKKLLYIVAAIFLSMLLLIGWELILSSRKPAVTTPGESLPTYSDGFVDYVTILDNEWAEGVTPENNAAVILFEMFGSSIALTNQPDEYFSALEIPIPPKIGCYVEPPPSIAVPPSPTTDELSRFERALDAPWSQEDLPEVAKWLDDNQETFDLVPDLVSRTHFYFPYKFQGDEFNSSVIGIVVQPSAELRDLARLVLIRGNLALQENRFDDCARDVELLKGIANTCNKGPTLIEELISIAISSIAFELELELISRCDWTSEKAKQRIVQLRDLRLESTIRSRVDKAERYMVLDAYRQLTLHGNGYGGYPPIGHESNNLDGLIKFAVQFSDAAYALQIINQHFDEFVALLDAKEPEKLRSNLVAIEDELVSIEDSLSKPHVIVGGLLQGRKSRARFLANVLLVQLTASVDSVINSELRMLVEQDLLEIAWALYAYKKDNGQYPKSLSELVPAYLEQIPDDRFTGSPLKYIRVGEGYKMYSVGRNRIDDGGMSIYADENYGDESVVEMTK